MFSLLRIQKIIQIKKPFIYSHLCFLRIKIFNPCNLMLLGMIYQPLDLLNYLLLISEMITISLKYFVLWKIMIQKDISLQLPGIRLGQFNTLWLLLWIMDRFILLILSLKKVFLSLVIIELNRLIEIYLYFGIQVFLLNWLLVLIPLIWVFRFGI